MMRYYTRRNPLRSPASRFWKLVRPSGECWLWTGALTTSGYPVWQENEDKPQILAARFAFELKHGRPPGKNLNRSCLNKLCVRADHLSEAVKAKEPPVKPPKPTFYEKFLAMIGPPDERGCRYLLKNNGEHYRTQRPKLTVGGKQLTAAHVSVLVHGVEIPEGRWVLHHCDNKACVAPDHLYIGDASDNAKDRTNRNRHRLGHKVSVQEQELILASPKSVLALSKELNRTWASIARVRRRGTVLMISTAASSSTCSNGHPKEGDWAFPSGLCRLCNRESVRTYRARKKAEKKAMKVYL